MATVEQRVDAILEGRCPKSSRHSLVMFTRIELDGTRRVGVECLHYCGFKVSLPQETAVRLILRELAEHDALPAVEGVWVHDWERQAIRDAPQSSEDD